MSIDYPAPRRGTLRALSTWLYRRPTLYLRLLLVPPLLWFGAVYLGSLLTLLWQGFYTFDDFTMAVTPDLTCEICGAVNAANYDIILRTLSMAVRCRWPAPCSHSRLPTTWRVTPGAAQSVLLYRGDDADVGQLYR